jgi:hypothetical protein
MMRMFFRLLGMMALVGLMWGVYLAYRWAEPNPEAMRAIGMTANTQDLALRMDKAAYTNYFAGQRNWSLWAERIDLLRPAGTIGLAGLQRADITDIRDGKLYDLSSDRTAVPRLAAVTSREARPTLDPDPATPAVTFSARQGHYTTGMPLSTPPELQLNYRVQWQFQLTGDVRLRTREGNRLNAPAIAILQLTNLHTGHTERRIVCDEGVHVSVDKTQVQANSVRYDPDTRYVECLGGVRAVMPAHGGQDTFQAERLFWSLKEQAIRCPETATGVMNGLPFTAEGLNIDLKRHVSEGARLKLRLNSSDDRLFSLP